MTGYYSQLRPHQYNGGLTPNKLERLYWKNSKTVTNFYWPLQAGGFPIHEGQPQIYINLLPDAKDLRDYILITPIPSLPVIYVYLSKKSWRCNT
nr:hypothetical protein [Providencia stuartii]